jgi:putative oxidoreductase
VYISDPSGKKTYFLKFLFKLKKSHEPKLRVCLGHTLNSHGRITFMPYVLLLGRLLFTLIFLMSGIVHFYPGTIEYAASDGVPLANLLVPLSGIIAAIGGLSILLGFKARWGAWLLVLFLIPVTLHMHDFWTFDNPVDYSMQQAMFLKNVALTGAALIIAYFGSGPLSLDNKV